MLDATAGLDSGASYSAPTPARPFLTEVTVEPARLRIAVTAQPFLGHTTVHAACRTGLWATARLLEALGHEVVEDAPPVDGDALAQAFLTVVADEVWADMREAARLAGRRPRPADFEPVTYALGLLGAATGAEASVAAWRHIQRTRRTVGHFFTRYDLLLTPTLAQPPLLIGAFTPTPSETLALHGINRLGAGWLLQVLGIAKPLAAKLYAFMPYTPLCNLTGQPAMSVPLHWSDDGLPIGMQVAARYGDEATLLRLAGQLERAQPWAERTPPG